MMGGVFYGWSPSKIQTLWFFVAGGLVFVGEEFALPAATELVLAFLGLLMVAVGMDVNIKRLGMFRIDGWTQAQVIDTYRGLAELLWGFVFICLGLVGTAVVVMSWFIPPSAGTFWSDMLGSTTGIGGILAAVGLMMLINGVIRALAGSGNVDPARLGGVPYMVDRLVGGAAFLLGAAISAIGLLLLVAPSVVTSAIKWIGERVLGS